MTEMYQCTKSLKSYQVADAVVGVERRGEDEGEFGQTKEIGADGERVDQVQVVGVTLR